MPFTGYNHFNHDLAIGCYVTLPPNNQQYQQQQYAVPERNRVAGVVATTKVKEKKKKQQTIMKHKKQQQKHIPKLQRKVPTDIVALGIVTLPEQVKHFTIQKRALTEENKRLQTLLATARKMIDEKEKGAHPS